MAAGSAGGSTATPKNETKLFELKCAILDGPGQAIEFLLLSWTETALLGQILVGSLLDLKFAILDGPGPAIEFLFWE